MTAFDRRSGTDLFAQDLDELINVIARGHSVWCTFCHQELFQLSDQMQKALNLKGISVV